MGCVCICLDVQQRVCNNVRRPVRLLRSVFAAGGLKNRVGRDLAKVYEGRLITSQRVPMWNKSIEDYESVLNWWMEDLWEANLLIAMPERGACTAFMSAAQDEETKRRHDGGCRATCPYNVL